MSAPRFALSLLATALLLASCETDRTYYPLLEGTYALSYDHVSDSGCFPDGFPWPPGATASLTLHRYPQSTELRTDLLGSLTPPLDGPAAADAVDVGGSQDVVLTSACTLAAVATAETRMVAAQTLAMKLSFVFDASGSRCDALAGETVDGIPFPALSNATDGSCTESIHGVAVWTPP